MLYIIEDMDIADATADVIVNAANGMGYMGGAFSIKKLCNGVAEHLNYYTGGKIEKEAKMVVKNSGKLLGFQPGELYKTGNYELNCKSVWHLVTMRIPGTSVSYKTVEKCLDTLYRELRETSYTSVALPLLGCGTGGLKAEKVKEMIEEKAKYYPEIKTILFMGFKKE